MVVHKECILIKIDKGLGVQKVIMTLEKPSLAFTVICEKLLVRYVFSTLLYFGQRFANFPSWLHLFVLVFADISQLKLMHVDFSFHADVSHSC